MKSVIRENHKKEIEYPCLMINNTGLIVFFNKKEHGLTMNHNNYYNIGHYSDVWCMEVFKPFNGTIELSNN